VIRKKIAHQILPHKHEDGDSHAAHGVSLIALFTYLQIFVLITAGLYIIRVKAPHILGTASFGAGEIIALTNAKRAQNNLGPLSSNSSLSSAAAAKAANMFRENYWAHNSPSGKTPWSFITAAGYRYVFAGENLARDFSDANSVVNAWMDSPSHRSNLLDNNFKEIGVAVDSGKLEGREGVLVVQMFGAGISQVPAAQPIVQASPAPSPATAGQQTAQNLPSSAVSPSPASEISPIPTPTLAPIAVGLNESNQNLPDESTRILATRQFAIAKIASLSIIAFIFLLFVIEVIVVVRSAHLSLRSGIIAHMGLLAFVLLALWYAVGGAII